jgi:hypothetical protein
MRKARQMVRGFAMAGFAGVLVACGGGGAVGPTDLAGAASGSGSDDGTTTGTGTGVVRLRCEARQGRSKISVDGNNLSPRNGTFSARVEASGGTAVSGTATAVGDEVEFDFDSNPDDIAQGATPIAANFVAARSGADVVGEILNAQGQVVARASAECEIR